MTIQVTYMGADYTRNPETNAIWADQAEADAWLAAQIAADDQALADQAASAAERPYHITPGQFRLCFTFFERAREAGFKRVCEYRVIKGADLTPPDPDTADEAELIIWQRYNDAMAYLAMRDDFEAAGAINMRDPAVEAALEMYAAWSLLDGATLPERQARAAEILAIKDEGDDAPNPA